MPGGSAAHQEDVGRDSVVGDGLVRRIGPPPASEKTARRGRLRAFRLDSSRMATMSRTAVPMVVMARLGVASIDGDGRGPGRLGFRFGRKLGEGRENGGSLHLL